MSFPQKCQLLPWFPGHVSGQKWACWSPKRRRVWSWPRHQASSGVTPTMFSALGLVQGLLGVDLRDSSQHPQFCFTFLLSIVGFSSPNTGLGQGAVDITFLQQSISDFRELLSKSKAMGNYQNCLQRGILRKHLLHTWDAMVLKMEKYKILKWFPLKWMWQTVK